MASPYCPRPRVPPSESAPYLGSDGPGDARLASHPPGPRGLAPKRGGPAPDADPPGAKGMGCVDPLRRRSPCAGVAISVYMGRKGQPGGPGRSRPPKPPKFHRRADLASGCASGWPGSWGPLGVGLLFVSILPGEEVPLPPSQPAPKLRCGRLTAIRKMWYIKARLSDTRLAGQSVCKRGNLSPGQRPAASSRDDPPRASKGPAFARWGSMRITESMNLAIRRAPVRGPSRSDRKQGSSLRSAIRRERPC
jgi:hypothetical protein